MTLAGTEAHVCAGQTILELLGPGYRAQVLSGAIGSRLAIDREFVLRSLEIAGAVVSTTEAALCERVGGAEHPRFKEIGALVEERTDDRSRTGPTGLPTFPADSSGFRRCGKNAT
jgi:hypothetical protein